MTEHLTVEGVLASLGRKLDSDPSLLRELDDLRRFLAVVTELPSFHEAVRTPLSREVVTILARVVLESDPDVLVKVEALKSYVQSQLSLFHDLGLENAAELCWRTANDARLPSGQREGARVCAERVEELRRRMKEDDIVAQMRDIAEEEGRR